jgi:leucyl/phenylalanyl-tRNA---protein transferase
MAEDADDTRVFWVEPKRRGILPLDAFKIGSRLRRTVRSDIYTVHVDRAFPAVIHGCATPAEGRESTWISHPLRALYIELWHAGYAHSVEVYEHDELVGGLYGVRLGAAFFGESMFHTKRDASKVALVHLVARLKAGGFQLCDTQFVTPHLAQFGVFEVGQTHYRRLLKEAIDQPANWRVWPQTYTLTGSEALKWCDL